VNNDKSFNVKIKKIVKYNSFEEYLSQEGLKRTLPGIKIIKEGCDIYYKYYTKEQEREFKILAIYVKVI
jgi:ASC-1-like (ASCH) protein